MITIKPNRSDMISEASYDEAEQCLYITFNKGGQYKYSDFPKNKFDELVNAESMGKHFHAHIKGKHDHEKV